MLERERLRYNRQIAAWLFLCSIVVVAMILLGGVTRLTHSGLSMVDWKPIMGVIPPIGEDAWQQTFERYQHFPEYQKVNKGMSLHEFKSIFLFEYAHRVLGRLIGILFLLPFLFFYFTRRLSPGLVPRLMVMFVLGGLQGLLGWYMVKSGLVDDPRVSQYRLTAHLGTAVLIYGYMMWVAFGLLDSTRPGVTASGPGLRRFSYAISSLLFLMILSGGLVAGTRAGLAYNTFPLMGNSFIPGGLYATDPGWLAAFEDVTTIQFNHRMFAYLLCVLITVFVLTVLRGGASGALRTGALSMMALLLVQVGLGISTLLYLVPVSLAAAHQVGAVGLFTSSLFVSHLLARGKGSTRAETAVA